MDVKDIFCDQDELLCYEGLGYDNDLYSSPAYSDDSGFSGQNFSLETLLDDVLPPVINDVEFTNIKDFSRSDSVSSNIHDHPYSLPDQTIEPVVIVSDTDEINVDELPDNAVVNNEPVSRQSIAKPVVTRKRNLSDCEPAEILSKSSKIDSKSDHNIDVLKCDDETFSYKDENGKVIVVDRSRKNAEMARLNRQRKKKHLSNLETEVKTLRSQNNKLSLKTTKQEKKIKTLEDEVAYLMSVIRNQTMLSSVLKAVSTVPGVSIGAKTPPGPKLYERLLPGKRMPTHDDDEDAVDYNGGVCLHVSNNKVSLEFCSTCNKNQ
eukprot:TCONS_00050348-protein